jgi:hypothetical protein
MLDLWKHDKQDQELEDLIKFAEDERPDALGEILAQNSSYQDFMAYFVALLKVSPRSHPYTFQLLHAAGLVGILVAIYFKQWPGKNHPQGSEEASRPARARASQICPALMPPVPVPGHPSFPSGHATQSMLMALCAGEATQNQHVSDTDTTPVWRSSLQALSRRIGHNREIAGLHFPSDTRAGFQLARQTFDILDEGPLFASLLDAATKEWPELPPQSSNAS